MDKNCPSKRFMFKGKPEIRIFFLIFYPKHLFLTFLEYLYLKVETTSFVSSAGETIDNIPGETIPLLHDIFNEKTSYNHFYNHLVGR